MITNNPDVAAAERYLNGDRVKELLAAKDGRIAQLEAEIKHRDEHYEYSDKYGYSQGCNCGNDWPCPIEVVL